MAVCIREVLYPAFDCMDRELYVKLNVESMEFDLPNVLPSRFKLRNTSLGHDVYTIASQPHEKTVLTSKGSLMANGMWITKSDAIGRGGVRPCVFGIPLSFRVKEALDLLPSTQILATYHGTGAAYTSIEKTNTLFSTVGQIGRGVYVGSFWKAVRFATRSQDYALREKAIVLRVLSYCRTVKVYPSSKPCTCDEYCRGRSIEKARSCDHLRDWSVYHDMEDDDAGLLLVGKHSDGTWRTQNEEWVLRPDRILRLAEAVAIDMKTINKDVYEPQQRTVGIL